MTLPGRLLAETGDQHGRSVNERVYADEDDPCERADEGQHADEDQEDAPDQQDPPFFGELIRQAARDHPYAGPRLAPLIHNRTPPWPAPRPYPRSRPCSPTHANAPTAASATCLHLITVAPIAIEARGQLRALCAPCAAGSTLRGRLARAASVCQGHAAARRKSMRVSPRSCYKSSSRWSVRH